MASAVTDWGSARFLAIVMGINAQPANVFAALCTDEPGTDIDGTGLANLEPDPLLGYARVQIPTGGSNWLDPDGSNYTANVNDVSFPTPTDVWPTITHFALCSASTAGDVFLYGEFDIPITPDPTNPMVLVAGSILMSFGTFSPSISEA